MTRSLRAFFLAVLVLLGAAVRPEDGAHGHVRVELLRQADPDRVAELVLDAFSADEKIVVRVRTVRESDLRPEILPVIPRIGDEGI